MTFSDAGPVPAQGQIAQQIFWYTAFTAPLTQPGTAAVNKDGSPKWRMAPSPHGPYWKTGMQNGYQDVGAWNFSQVHPAAQDVGGLAVRAVRHIQDRVAAQVHCGADIYP